MDFAYQILKIVGILIGIIVVLLLSVNVIQTFYILYKEHKMKIYGSYKDAFFNFKHTGPMNLIKWVLLDIKRGKSYFKLFGIWCFTGYYGEGKSLGEVTFAFRLKEKYPEMDIKIYSNFEVEGQDGRITCWEDILDLPKNTILLFDEIQSTFTSTKYADFPIELLWKLTQCRKHGLAIFCTSPVYTRMSIQLRESCDYVVECKNIFHLDRLFKYTFFKADEYEAYKSVGGLLAGVKKNLFVDFTYSFVARDIDYSRYDTTAQIDKFDVVKENPKSTKKLSNNEISALENRVIKKVLDYVARQGVPPRSA
jgi:hypothetical protein